MKSGHGSAGLQALQQRCRLGRPRALERRNLQRVGPSGVWWRRGPLARGCRNARHSRRSSMRPSAALVVRCVAWRSLVATGGSSTRRAPTPF